MNYGGQQQMMNNDDFKPHPNMMGSGNQFNQPMFNKQNTMPMNRNSMRETRTNQLMGQNMADDNMQEPLLQNYNQNQMMGGGMDRFQQQQMYNQQMMGGMQ